MKTKVLMCLFLVGVLLFGITLQGLAAETYPNRPVRIVVPFAPGGGTDTIARCVGEWLTRKWGQQVFIDNRPGGNTIVGTEVVAKARPDGYTWLLTPSSVTLNENMNKKLPYNLLKDFIHITKTTKNAYLVAVHPSLPVKSIGELITYLRSKPDVIVNFGVAGTGGGQHLACERFKLMVGVKNLTGVAYRGTVPAITDLLSGYIQLMFSPITAMIEYVKAGTLRGLAVTDGKRIESIPNMPTVAESGLPGYEAFSWHGISVPAGVPEPIVKILSRDIVDALKSQDVRSRIEMSGGQVIWSTPEEFDSFIRSEITKWKDVIRMAGLVIK